MKYFIIKGLAAHHVDAAASLLYVGLPTMTAFHGFAWNFVRNLNEISGKTAPIAVFLSNDEPAKLIEFAVGVSHFTLSAGLKRFTKSHYKEEFKQFHHSSIDARRASLEFSFIVGIESGKNDAKFTLEKAKEAVVGLRLAGSALELRHIRVSVADSREEAIAELKGPLFLLRDATAEVIEAKQNGVSLLEAIRSLLDYKKAANDDTPEHETQKDDLAEEASVQRSLEKISPITDEAPATLAEASVPEEEAVLNPLPRGWHIPLAVGYRLLEDPVLREGARQTKGALPSREALHAFAESVLGVARVQLVSSVRAESRRTGTLPPVFWRPATLEAGRLLVLTALCDEELALKPAEKQDATQSSASATAVVV